MKSQTGDIETGLGLHRPDVVSVMADQMADRKVIVLEEPPEPVFERMLDGKLGIDEYLMGGSRHRVSRIWSRRQSTDEKAVHTEKDHQTNRIASAEPA